jgi:hypothetical protein
MDTGGCHEKCNDPNILGVTDKGKVYLCANNLDGREEIIIWTATIHEFVHACDPRHHVWDQMKKENIAEEISETCFNTILPYVPSIHL